MKLYRPHNPLIGIFTVFVFTSLFAQNTLVDEFSDADNRNNLGGSWFYYDDTRGTKIDDRTQAAPASTPSAIDVPFTTQPRRANGNPRDTFRVKNYQFGVREEPGNLFGAMPFTYGEKWKTSWGTAYPFVGVSTGLAAEGKSIDITGATAVKFKLRSHGSDLAVTFMIETMDVIRDSTFAYFQKQLLCTKGAWNQFEIPVADLAQPSWVRASDQREFNYSQAAVLTWEVHQINNEAVKSDTLDVDDVIIGGAGAPPPRNPCGGFPSIRPATGAFSTFEVVPRHQTPLGTYWYAFDDRAVGGNSRMTKGAELDSFAGIYTLDWHEKTGYSGSGTGAAVEVRFGKPVKHILPEGDTATAQGFAGIGFYAYDSAAGLYFNATTGKMGSKGDLANCNGIYFEYSAVGDFKYLTLEVRDMHDVADKDNPARKESRGPGIVWYRNVCPTGLNVWQKIRIPFDSLLIHDTWKDYVAIPLDRTRLARFEFKAYGPENGTGAIFIDNVYFPPASEATSVVPMKPGIPCEPFFRAFYRTGTIRIVSNGNGDLTNATFTVIDASGKAILTSSLAGSAPAVVTTSEKNIPNGLYFIAVRGIAKGGKAVSLRSALAIIR